MTRDEPEQHERQTMRAIGFRRYGPPEGSSIRIPKVDRTLALGFRALLTENGDRRVQLHSA
jgi:hypothetical protein